MVGGERRDANEKGFGTEEEGRGGGGQDGDEQVNRTIDDLYFFCSENYYQQIEMSILEAEVSGEW